MNPKFDRCKDAQFKLNGCIAPYLRGISEQWLKIAPSANPGMLEMFADRDRLPYRDLVPWAGEFSGKYLTGAVQVLRLTGDPELRSYVKEFVDQLVELQAPDGYLGPWPRDSRLTNKVVYPDGRVQWPWDTWGHYHNMLGLILWHEDTGDKRALACAKRMADLLCAQYLGKVHPRLAETGNSEMNLAPAHSLCLLYKVTGAQKYLDLARQIVDEEFSAPFEGLYWPSGNYLKGPLAGLEFFELPKPRWESLHPIMALAELYHLTGEAKYRQAFESLWRSIANLDRHNNGGFSSGEQANGNPFAPGAIETCCTIAWMAMSVEMLRMTGDSRVADELELSFLNSVVGMHSITGRWATYNTPMDGIRRASAHEIVFQSREGTPELNCCSVNSTRGFGLLSDWAILEDAEGLVLNWYGPGSIKTSCSGCGKITLTQETEYPCDGKILIKVDPSRAAEFTLKLRIPRWSCRTLVKINGQAVKGVPAGSYLALRRTWKKGDRIELKFDMAFHYWVGELECAGKTSIYRGPVLLTYDRRFNEMDPDDVPSLNALGLKGRIIAWRSRMPPMILMEFKATDGRRVRLCDHGSAGEGGTPYRSWLAVKHEGVELPQFYASPRAALDCAELQRFACQIRNIPLFLKQVEGGSLKPDAFVAKLMAIEQGWTQFRQALEKAQRHIASDPQSESGQALKKTLARLDAELGILTPTALDKLGQVKTEIIKKYKLGA